MHRHLLVTVAALLFATSAVAGPYYVEVSGTMNWYDMGEVNEFLDSVNEDYGETVIDPLDSGGSFAIGLGRVYNQRLATTLVYEHLFARTESNNDDVPMKISAPANIVRFQLAFAIAKLGSVIPYVQGGVGIIWNGGALEYRDEFGNDIKHEYGGSTIDIEGLVGIEIRLNDRFGLDLSGGYRFAEITDAKWDATSFGGYGTFDGPGFNYSGGLVRIGLRIGLDWSVGDSSETRDTSEDQTGWM